MKTDLADALRLAERAARTGGQIALHHFRKGVTSRRKADGSPVSDADLSAEEAVRKVLGDGMPGVPVLGEEFGGDSPDETVSGTRWIVDPIDGTRNFVRGIPLWSTLVALETSGTCTVGVAYGPALDEITTAATGNGCKWNGEPVQVSTIAKLDKALVVHGGLDLLLIEPYHKRFLDLARRTERQRGFGDFYGHQLVTTGRAEIMVETGINAWDVACFKVLIEEAGGRFTDLRGEDTIYSGTALATNGLLHEAVLDVFEASPAH